MKKKIKKDKLEPYKIRATIYTNEELEELDHKIGNDLDNIEEAIETIDNLRVYNLNKFISDKECRAITTVLKFIKKLEKELKEEREFNVETLKILKECVHKDRLKELREIDNIDLIQCKIKALLGE